MNFDLSEEQVAVRDLAEQIFTGSVTVERVKEIEASEERFDRELWRELADADLLGISLPEEHGGSGLGFVEPCWCSSSRAGSSRRCRTGRRWCAARCRSPSSGPTRSRPSGCRPSIAGEVLLTAALVGGRGERSAARRRRRATPDGDGWRLDGFKPVGPGGARRGTRARARGDARRRRRCSSSIRLVRA